MSPKKTDIENLLRNPTITVDAAARVLSMGRNAAYDAVRRGEIETMKVGKRYKVLSAPLRRRLGIETAAMVAA